MSTLKTNTLTGTTTAGSISVTGEGNSTTTNLQQGLCKHWVSFDPLNSNNLDDSYNNASVTDGGTGIFTFTNTNNMGNAVHAPLIGSEIESSYQDAADAILAAGRTTTGMRAYHVENNSATDNGILTMHTWGDLA
tara:strand:+ start:248 stop:652 length:405 start_codon:yes stop_codon:yes gene_type:complete